MLPVKRDIIFKIFFADERNIEFLTDFLKSALTIPAEEYDEIVIVDPHLIREFPSDKLGVIDVKLKTSSGKTIHVEIQVAPLPHMERRIAYYDAKMIAEQIGKSEKYKDIKQVISIVITEDEFIKDSPSYHHRFTMYDAVNRVELTDIVEVHTLELCKIDTDLTEDRLKYWLEFIKAEGEIELETVANRDPLIKKAVVRLMELSADEKTRLLYEAREKERMDLESLLEEAREKERMDAESREDEARAEGEKAKAIVIAKNLLALDVPLEKVISATGLTHEEVEDLRKTASSNPQ